MKWIAIQSYYKVERVLSGIEMKTIKEDRSMYLYVNKIVTAHREFAIEDIHDLSFRRMGEMRGCFYLHTQQGVFSYNVHGDPQAFIAMYKELTLSS